MLEPARVALALQDYQLQSEVSKFSDFFISVYWLEVAPKTDGDWRIFSEIFKWVF